MYRARKRSDVQKICHYFAPGFDTHKPHFLPRSPTVILLIFYSILWTYPGRLFVCLQHKQRPLGRRLQTNTPTKPWKDPQCRDCQRTLLLCLLYVMKICHMQPQPIDNITKVINSGRSRGWSSAHHLPLWEILHPLLVTNYLIEPPRDMSFSRCCHVILDPPEGWLYPAGNSGSTTCQSSNGTLIPWGL